MLRKSVLTIASLSFFACGTLGQLTVHDYTAKSGQRVVAGQAQPKSEYDCKVVSEGKQEWGIKGNMDKAGAQQRAIASAVDQAPTKGANYVFVDPPAEVGIGGLNVNALSRADVTWYKCKNLPAKK